MRDLNKITSEGFFSFPVSSVFSLSLLTSFLPTCYIELLLRRDEDSNDFLPYSLFSFIVSWRLIVVALLETTGSFVCLVNIGCGIFLGEKT